jgi:tRNA nucleotidyltransferase/poly(A) polymerase
MAERDERVAKLRRRPALAALAAALPAGVEGWAVGGAVRDVLLGRTPHDLDVTVTVGAAALARRVADALGAAFYLLDPERGSGRVVLIENGERTVMDVTNLRAPTLEQDLRERDFTLNAVAVPLTGAARLVDPTGGAADLAAGLLRTAAAANLERDPVRALRAVRFRWQLGLRLDPATRAAAAAVAPRLAEPAAERTREELVKLLQVAAPAAAVADAAALGLLAAVLPEVEALRAADGAWERSLRWVDALGRVAGLVAPVAPAGPEPRPARAAPDPPAAPLGERGAAAVGAAAARLAPFAAELAARLEAEVAVDHPARALLVLAALLHGIAEEAGMGSPRAAASRGDATVERRLRALRFARGEIDWVRAVVRLTPSAALAATVPLDRRALHRFHREAAPVAAEVCLLTVAAAIAEERPAAQLGALLDRVAEALDALWRRHREVVAPVPLLRGEDLLGLGAAAGPQLGATLAAVVEAQAAGEVATRDQALALAGRLLGDPGARRDPPDGS